MKTKKASKKRGKTVREPEGGIVAGLASRRVSKP